MRTMTLQGLVLGIAVLGGWWASRAAATGTDARPRPATIASADDDAFRRLLEDVQRRGVQLDQRERELAERSAALESLEEAVAESLTGLQSKEAAAAGSSTGSATGSCRLHGGVTRIYESMRPEEAAQILDQLDDETLRVVFARMEAKQVAAIMASMSRERAVAFTKTLAADPETPTAAHAR
jgi:flagellar motility protein MotE (MotC chaperone)